MDLASKLQIKRGMSVALVNVPAGLMATIAPEAAAEDEFAADVLIFFARDTTEFKAASQHLAEAVRRDALTWLAYPKGRQLGTDLNRDIVREALATQGAQTVRQVSLDDVWSALRLRAG